MNPFHAGNAERWAILLVFLAFFRSFGGRDNKKLEASGEMELKRHSNATTAGHSAIPPRIEAMLRGFEGSCFTNIVKLAGLHDPTVPLRPIRPSALDVLHNWTFVANEVRAGGHEWCAIVRDNWSCVGERYREVLRTTPLYNNSFDLNHAFPHGSNVYVEGNSKVAELVYAIVCSTADVDVWTLDGNEGVTDSILAYAPASNVTLFLLCNPTNLELQMKAEKSLALLRKMGFAPDYVVRGAVNGVLVDKFLELTHVHRQLYMKAFPRAFYLEYFDPHTPAGCGADFRNCVDSAVHAVDRGHTCLPGPINGPAEDMVRAMLTGNPDEALCDLPGCECRMTNVAAVILECRKVSDWDALSNTYF